MYKLSAANSPSRVIASNVGIYMANIYQKSNPKDKICSPKANHCIIDDFIEVELSPSKSSEIGEDTGLRQHQRIVNEKYAYMFIAFLIVVAVLCITCYIIVKQS